MVKHIISFVIRKVPRKHLQLFSHFALRMMKVFYIGNNVTCPVCDSNFREFVPYGRKPPRKNALCPNCLALERHRLLWLYLKNETDFFTKEAKLLHIAPELCFIDRFEKIESLEYITGDLESPLAKVKMDINEIPFEENSFDMVFCNHVMEHIPDDIHAMKEVYRVLKPGGWAILQSPQDMNMQNTYEDPEITDPKDREEHFKQSDHYRIYGLDYGERLEKGGFEVKEIPYPKQLDQEKVERYALPKEEIIYLCTKPE
ncbi:class I SAM-dependent methyltransferase [Mangrovivirga sp. M17]|uniref:Class I SAM-dependent methyltransferase n=1 Tax=Mangrovivirga halotolerans TaxID=2993936 RepID=A0ABT3RWM7_9BACT|nr:class I SAM-dependent methyltransferase [Mangrovivirga halotolerans]MCX2745977.1 class I SAM-dependent methyltransferase [Mangrovivirga halotolerans]